MEIQLEFTNLFMQTNEEEKGEEEAEVNPEIHEDKENGVFYEEVVLPESKLVHASFDPNAPEASGTEKYSTYKFKERPFKISPSDLKARTHVIKRVVTNGKVSRTWICGMCHKEFRFMYTLIRHIPTHTDERQFRCLVCGKAFRQMSTLTQHKATHSEHRPHQCEFCMKKFNRASTLIAHKRIHAEAKAFTCELCGKGFHQKGNLKNHEYIHTNERPFKCDVCGRGFNQLSNLVVHKNRIHFGGMVFNCSLCGKEYTKFTSYQRHLETTHSDVVKKEMDDDADIGDGTPSGSKQFLDISDFVPKDRLLSPEKLASSSLEAAEKPETTCTPEGPKAEEAEVPVESETVVTKKKNFEIKRADQSILPLIERKPTPEMFDVFSKNEVPFVYFHSLRLGKPAICKAVLEGDYYRLKNLSLRDIKNRTEIQMVVEIHEVDMDGDTEYLISPYTKRMKVQHMAEKLAKKAKS